MERNVAAFGSWGERKSSQIKLISTGVGQCTKKVQFKQVLPIKAVAFSDYLNIFAQCIST